MISNFTITENDNPNLLVFKKLKENGTLEKIKQNIQNDFKEQQYVPQNAFTRANLSKILKKTQNFTKNYMDPLTFKASEKKFSQPNFYKSIGKISYSSDCKLIDKMDFEDKDKKLAKNQVKIINKLIKKSKFVRKLPAMKTFYEKLILWLAKKKNCPKIEAHEAVTLLNSLHKENFVENKMDIDDPLYKDHENDEVSSVGEHHFQGIIYPKLENIIEFFEIKPPNKNIIVKKAFNLIARENDLFHFHVNDTMACSFWKLKDIKKFFILFLKLSKNFEEISKKIGKNEQECRTLYRITKEFFDLKGRYKDIRRNKTKDVSKEIIQEVKK